MHPYLLTKWSKFLKLIQAPMSGIHTYPGWETQTSSVTLLFTRRQANGTISAVWETANPTSLQENTQSESKAIKKKSLILKCTEHLQIITFWRTHAFNKQKFSDFSSDPSIVIIKSCGKKSICEISFITILVGWISPMMVFWFLKV